MKATHKKNYRGGVLQVGWASWDEGDRKARSIKYAYLDRSGRTSRGAPELPFDILLDMLIYAVEQGELDAYPELTKEAYRKLATVADPDKSN